jgi:hypothetical protein
MGTDRTRAIQDLLVRAEVAHGVYETTELDGRYDEDWPRWYAQWAIDNGLAGLVGRELSVDVVERILASSWSELEASSPTPAESWPAIAADRLLPST